MRGRVAVLGLLAVSALVAFAAAPAAQLVLISVDGLRPEFYQSDAYSAPELRRLARAGASARAAETVFPSVTYPSHAAIVTGVRPARHGVLFNTIFDPKGMDARWYERHDDLKSSPLWEWARASGRITAAVSWPSTVGAPIDLLVPERDYYRRSDPLKDIRDASTPGLFDRLGVALPAGETFKSVAAWDDFLAAVAAAMIRQARPHLLLLHLVQLDFIQHQGGREAPDLPAALGRIDAHVASLVRALGEAGIAERAVVIVTGDHGFQDVSTLVLPNEILVRAGLRGCPRLGDDWRATVHTSGGGAAVFVNGPDAAATAAAAEQALRREAGSTFTVLTRRQLDELGAMPGAALGLEAAPGFAFGGGCDAPLTRSGRGGTHGFLPSRPSMATGFIAHGVGVRRGVIVDRVRLVDVAPTAARLLGLTAPPIEGRVLDEILQ